MGKKKREFDEYRARMNERILAEDNRVIKRVYSVDSLTYDQGSALPRKTKELLGLVVGGTIVVPHLRRAVEFLDDLETE